MIAGLNHVIERCKPMRVLYIEDDNEVGIFTLDLLKAFFDNITHAKDGKEALKYFSDGKYDLILTDLNLPYMDGFELIEEIRQVDQTLPIIIITAYTHDDTAEKMATFSVDKYLTKPLTLPILVETLSELEARL